MTCLRLMGGLMRMIPVLGFLLGIQQTRGAAGGPVPIIFDTDMGPDCDDVGALFVLHGAVEQGEARLLATIGCTSAEALGPCIDAINIWFGRSEIPVGVLKDPGFLAKPSYADEIARIYPRRFASSAEYPDAVRIYRKVLAAQPDGSVVVAAVGPLRNLANLLKSKSCAASPLNGPALVAAKVKRLDVMGGCYPPLAKPGAREWNCEQDPAAAALVCETWPTPVLFNGEGGSTLSGRRATFEMAAHNPLTLAYKLYPGVGYAGDRSSWDPISCLVAVRGAAPWYRVVSGGTNVTNAATGANLWQPGGDRNHSYLVLDTGRPKREVETAIEDLMTAGKGRPRGLVFDTALHADAGAAFISASVGRKSNGAWQFPGRTGWIECRYGEGRKYRLDSYALDCADPAMLPAAIELAASDDGGVTWKVLDRQDTTGHTPDRLRAGFPLTDSRKWSLYRLNLTAAGEQGLRVKGVRLNERIDCRPGVKVSSLVLDHTALELPTHGRAALNATLTPRDTHERLVTWKSSDPKVAEIRRLDEQAAVVVGRSPGRCSVTAEIDGVATTLPVIVGATTLPPLWHYHELASPALAGAAHFADGVFTVTGCGHALTAFWERERDQGIYVSQEVAAGDSAIAAQVLRLAPDVGGPGGYPHDQRPSTAAGLMLRESLTDPCSRFVAVQIDARGKLSVRWRDKAGDQDDNGIAEIKTGLDLPLTLRLVRREGRIEVHADKPGADPGTPLWSRPADFSGSVRAGLFVSSGNRFATTTAAFQNVMITQPKPAP